MCMYVLRVYCFVFLYKPFLVHNSVSPVISFHLNVVYELILAKKCTFDQTICCITMLLTICYIIMLQY